MNQLFKTLKRVTRARAIGQSGTGLLLAREVASKLRARKADLNGADYIYVFWTASFGHQVTRPDILARRFRGYRVALVFIDCGRMNRRLVESFASALTVVRIEVSDLSRRLMTRFLSDERIANIFNQAVQSILSKGDRAPTVVEDFWDVSQRDEEHPFILYYPQWFQLMSENSGRCAEAPKEAIEGCESHLFGHFPELKSRWPVSLWMRRKFDWRRMDQKVFQDARSYGGSTDAFQFLSDLESDVRDTAPQPYSALIKRIVDLGGYVFVGGEADMRHFSDLPHCLSYGDIGLDRHLADLYFLTQCRYLVCGHSGPVAVAAVFQVPTFITNCGFFWQAGFRTNQIIAYKDVREKKTGRFLTPEEIFSPPVIEFQDTSEFSAAGLEVVDQDEEALLADHEEMVRRYVLGDETHDPAYEENLKWFKNLVPAWSLPYLTDCGFAPNYLVRLREQSEAARPREACW